MDRSEAAKLANQPRSTNESKKINRSVSNSAKKRLMESGKGGAHYKQTLILLLQPSSVILLKGNALINNN